jgi:hypothetical protein
MNRFISAPSGLEELLVLYEYTLEFIPIWQPPEPKHPTESGISHGFPEPLSRTEE